MLSNSESVSLLQLDPLTTYTERFFTLTSVEFPGLPFLKKTRRIHLLATNAATEEAPEGQRRCGEEEKKKMDYCFDRVKEVAWSLFKSSNVQAPD